MLKIQNFRGFDKAQLKLDEKFTIISGDNCTGKTNIGIALHYLNHVLSCNFFNDRDYTLIDKPIIIENEYTKVLVNCENGKSLLHVNKKLDNNFIFSSNFISIDQLAIDIANYLSSNSSEILIDWLYELSGINAISFKEKAPFNYYITFHYKNGYACELRKESDSVIHFLKIYMVFYKHEKQDIVFIDNIDNFVNTFSLAHIFDLIDISLQQNENLKVIATSNNAYKVLLLEPKLIENLHFTFCQDEDTNKTMRLVKVLDIEDAKVVIRKEQKNGDHESVARLFNNNWIQNTCEFQEN